MTKLERSIRTEANRLRSVALRSTVSRPRPIPQGGEMHPNQALPALTAAFKALEIDQTYDAMESEEWLI